MVFDAGKGAREKGIWLFGGWDGTENWGDLWRWTESLGWQEIPSTTGSIDELTEPTAPAARSCHTLVIDSSAGKLYVTGRYLEEESAPAVDKNDFWMFDMDLAQWHLLSGDTAVGFFTCGFITQVA